MYSDSGGELVRPESVVSPASGAMWFTGLGLNVVAVLISIIFLIRITLHDIIF